MAAALIARSADGTGAPVGGGGAGGAPNQAANAASTGSAPSSNATRESKVRAASSRGDRDAAPDPAGGSGGSSLLVPARECSPAAGDWSRAESPRVGAA